MLLPLFFVVVVVTKDVDSFIQSFLKILSVEQREKSRPDDGLLHPFLIIIGFFIFADVIRNIANWTI